MYRVNHLVYRYQTKPVFSPCNLDIARGEYLVLMGDNGSGKSTFLNLLAGFLKPSEGTIYFMEQSLTAWKKDPIHKKKYYANLGILFQETDTQLFNATVYDELAFGPRQLQLSEHETAKRINDCLNLLKITHLSNQVPYQLSGGEKKKVAFASLLVMNPDVYLLDEPFAGLTKESEKLFKKIIKNLHQLGKTIILSTHDYLSICEEADSILLFDSAVTRYSKEEIEANANLLQHLKRY
ncbi:ABC transporter ATP-binding protein [Enterococcus faecalis]|nr:ABC transporter ATP-binding protein [Enterococcus faecalis]